MADGGPAVTRQRWDIDIARVIVRGAGTTGLNADEVRDLVEGALTRRFGVASLPSGRAMRTEVVIEAGPLASGGPAGIARAVTAGVVQAVAGRPARG